MRLSRKELQEKVERQSEKIYDLVGRIKILEAKHEALKENVFPVLLNGRLESNVGPYIRGPRVDLATVINAWLDVSGEKLVYHESKIVVE